MRSQSHWYQPDGDESCLDPAHEAFLEARQAFSSTLSKDPKKISTLHHATRIEDVHNMVLDAKSRYAAAHKDEKVGKWLSKFSSRVRFYGNIIDVLAQHHPEYVALAWGTMKCLFVMVENHEVMIKSLAKALCHIGESLPRTELVSMLYPTEKMKQIVAELYAHVMRFLIRARDWYQESKLRHILHSLTRPVELRYADLKEEIETRTRIVDDLASAGAQAEQRDMHLKIEEMIERQKRSDALLLEMRHMMVSYQSINSSAHPDTNQRLSDLQVSQIINFTSGACNLDVGKSLQYCAFMIDRHLRGSGSTFQPFWLTTRFKVWKDQERSSLIMIKGVYPRRFEVRKFCVNAIDLLHNLKIPVVWALKTIKQDTMEAPTAIDLLKDIVSQVLRFNVALHTEKSLGLSCATFQRAETESEWCELLGSVLAGLSQVYIIIDIETVSARYVSRERSFNWPSAFLGVFQRMAERGSKTVVKTILVSYGSNVFLAMNENGLRDSVISLGRAWSAPAVGNGKMSVRQKGTPSIGRGRRRGLQRGGLTL